MLRLSRPLGAFGRRQLLSTSVLAQSRSFADRKDTKLSSDPAFLPGTSSKVAPANPEVPIVPKIPGQPGLSPAASPASPSTISTIPVENVPKIPPSPPPILKAPPTTPATVSPPAALTPPPPPAPPTKPRRRFRTLRFFFYLLLISALGYGGAVFYALRNDNFHDFFTEYVPYGEEAVLYFEELSFRRRFPNAKLNMQRSSSAPKPDEARVTIPSRAGLLSHPVDTAQGSGNDDGAKGKHMSAVDANKPTQSEKTEARQDPAGATPREKSAAVEGAKKDASKAGKTASTGGKESLTSSQSSTSSGPKSGDAAAPSPAIAPVSSIAVLELPDANEPAVKDLVNVVNDLITVINSDGSANASRYTGPVQKAKEQLQSAAKQIGALKEAERKAAEERVAQAHREFDDGAKILLARIETAQKEDEARYLQEFDTERKKLADRFEERLKTELRRAQEVADKRLENELTEQGIELQRKFISDVQSLVESERSGRLSKLSVLSTSVDDLTNLTSNWNGVIDSNLATQKLQVAVDTVRSALESSNSESKLKPFVREMAALKLTAEGDPVVEAAVASVNPSAYQKGIPSASQLIDRFRRVASEVRKASLLPEDAGVASHAASVLLSRVMFKKQGQPEGNDVESILTRTETLLEEGDLDSAAREMNGLKGWAGVLSKDWLGDVRKVLEVKQALDVCETEARLQCLRVE